MKRTVSIMYRFAFLILGLWTILQNVSFNLPALPEALKTFPVFSIILFIICIGISFWTGVKNKKYTWLLHIKSTLTFLSWFIILFNLKLLLGNINIQWIMKILLPLMMIIDHILFDSIQRLKISNFLIWAAGLLFILFGIPYLFDIIFGIDNFFDFFRGNFANFLKILPQITGAGLLMYISDTLFSSGNKKNAKDLLKLLLRIFLILIEIYSFYKLSNANVTTFLRSLWHYTPLVNFLCLLCISVLVIVRFFGISKTDSLFTRIKALFTIAISGSFLIQLFIVKDFKTLSDVNTIHYVLAPVIMLADLILFDNKKAYYRYDPVIWILLPVFYSLMNMIFKFSTIYSVVSLMGGFGLLLCLGYAFFLLGKIR